MKTEILKTERVASDDYTSFGLIDSRALIATVEGRLEWYFQDLEELVKK